MNQKKRQLIKQKFLLDLRKFVANLNSHVSTSDKQWSVKGFIDVFKNIYTISGDTKIVSKILEIHIFPRVLEFAENHRFKLVLAEKQNWYPDISFISKDDEEIKFAIDIKTTYRLANNPDYVNGFTLGSHGEYFINRDSTKNIQFPYGQYLGHYCIGAIYTRNSDSSIAETHIVTFEKLESITSVVSDFLFFACEK
jgi:hypothetical protein